MVRIGVYGGAFDPPTKAHMLCVENVLNSNEVDEMLIIPSGVRVDKKNMSPYDVRHKMTTLSVKELLPGRNVSVSDVERNGSLKTFDLLSKLKSERQSDDIIFIVGSDWLQSGSSIAETWYRGRDLVNNYKFLVLYRPDTIPRLSDLSQYGPNFTWLDDDSKYHSTLSSTFVRQQISRCAPVEDYVGTSVAGYLSQLGLYRESRIPIKDTAGL